MSAALTSIDPGALASPPRSDITLRFAAIELAAQRVADQAPALTETTRDRLRELLGGAL